MATLTAGYGFTTTEQVTAAKLASLVNNATISSITGTDIANTTIDLTTKVTGTLPLGNGGTGQTSATAAFDALAPTTTQGDIIYHNGTDNVRLAKDTSSTRYLSNTGSSNNPAWAQVALTTGVTGTLPVANGGTGLAALGSALQVLRTNSGVTALEFATPVFSSSFTSTGQTITAAGQLTIAHGLGAAPKLVFARIKNTSAELNYSIGDEVAMNLGQTDGVATGNQGLSIICGDSTNLVIRFGSTAASLRILDKTTGAPTSIDNTKWQLYVSAWV